MFSLRAASFALGGVASRTASAAAAAATTSTTSWSSRFRIPRVAAAPALTAAFSTCSHFDLLGGLSVVTDHLQKRGMVTWIPRIRNNNNNNKRRFPPTPIPRRVVRRPRLVAGTLPYPSYQPTITPPPLVTPPPTSTSETDQQSEADRLKQVSLDHARTMPRSVQEMDNQLLFCLGEMGNHDARSEILKRHIMQHDQVSYAAAEQTFAMIAAKNREGKFLLALPYQIGIVTAMTAAVAAGPMVFDLYTAQWFNEHFVTTQIPPPEDLETVFETGSWTWNWMEPPLGTISFILLALQFSRAQMQNLGVMPYTEFVKQVRAQRLAQAFPQYHADILMKYSQSTDIHH